MTAKQHNEWFFSQQEKKSPFPFIQVIPVSLFKYMIRTGEYEKHKYNFIVNLMLKK